MATLPPYVNIFHTTEYCQVNEENNPPFFRPTYYSIHYHFVVRLEEIELFKHLALLRPHTCYCRVGPTEHNRVRVFNRTQFLELDTIHDTRQNIETAWAQQQTAELLRLLPPN